jgi:hypothetical protein
MKGALRAILLSAALGLAACGPVTSTTSIIDAREKLTEARREGAETFAPYEYAKADLYLHKAKELQGHSEYQQSDLFAIRAKDMAGEALRVTGANKKRHEQLLRAREQKARP